jgi:hypothetical protein
MWVVLGLLGSFALLMLILVTIYALTFPVTWAGLFALAIVLNIRRMLWPEGQSSSQ